MNTAIPHNSNNVENIAQIERKETQGLCSQIARFESNCCEICGVIIFISEFLNCETILNLEITCHDYS